MSLSTNKINRWLIPISWIYGIVVTIRNTLFDSKIIKSSKYNFPVISIGNITIGGTGKTPHVEYLVKLLKKECEVAVLSRGYRRKTKGFVIAEDAEDIQLAYKVGDELCQIKRKYPKITVVADVNRRRAIERLCKNTGAKPIETFILDDAFQYRYITPGINILLIDYNRMIANDRLLPAGRLRESRIEQHRADIIIVTKCPKRITPIAIRTTIKIIEAKPYQQIYFTTMRYGKLMSVYSGEKRTLSSIEEDENVLLITGIAQPKSIEEEIKKYTNNVVHIPFSDHHNFTKKDFLRINETFKSMSYPKIIITTQKDMARLCDNEQLNKEAKDSLYTLPIEVSFLQKGNKEFDKQIIDHVRKYRESKASSAMA